MFEMVYACLNSGRIRPCSNLLQMAILACPMMEKNGVGACMYVLRCFFASIALRI